MSGVAEERIKLLNGWRSMFGMRVLIALKEKGVAYEYQEEDLRPDHKSQLLLESNPVHKKIPVLLHNAKPICESLIILQYIDEAWPSADAPFLPSDPYQRALARFWADYVDKKVYDAFLLIYKNVEGSDLMEQGKRGMTESMVVLDGALRDVFGGGPYFGFGGKGKMGLVDMVLASYICWFHTLETLGNFKVIEESKCPHLFSWAQAVVQRPSVKEAFAIAPPEKVLESALAQRKILFGA